MVQPEKSSPTKRPVRPLAKQSRHHHRPLERFHHHHLLLLQTKGAAMSAALRLLRLGLPAGRLQMMSKRSIGRTFQLKTNKHSLHGLTSFSPVTRMDLCLLPPHPLYPSPQTVQVIKHPRRRLHRDPRHHFLIVGLVPKRVKIPAPTFKTK